uniref:DNA-directed primase/polymerase protein n=1 Tax=Panagrellus redivivus TaxID=6233 RepID=A0A7E4VBJ6_PANRE
MCADIEREVGKTFTVYPKQVFAFEAQAKQKNGRMFSFEMPNPYMTQGRRKFIVADLTKFWVWYRYQFNCPRHFYEIIQENYPCRLYFDLEYYKADNPDIEEGTILSEFFDLVCTMIREEYGLDIDEKAFLLLDSTTADKFSTHATVHLPEDTLFPNNVAMREFIAALTERMSMTGIGIVKKGDEETFICDPAVYTKNRSFRILHSSKCGKTTVLKYREDCKFYETVPKDDRQIFLDSITIPPNYQALKTLKVVETKGRVLKRTRQDAPGGGFVARPNCAAITTDFDVEVIETGTGKSPFPELDAYVAEFNTQFVPNVEIRTWSLLMVKANRSMRVSYQFNNCRYCLRMGREHKSNNVYWTVVLEREWMFQRCFDYDCRNYISYFFQLPRSVMDAIKPRMDSVFKLEEKAPSTPADVRKQRLNNSFHSSQYHKEQSAITRATRHGAKPNMFESQLLDLKSVKAVAPVQAVTATHSKATVPPVTVAKPKPAVTSAPPLKVSFAPPKAQAKPSTSVDPDDSFFSSQIDRVFAGLSPVAPKTTPSSNTSPKQVPIDSFFSASFDERIAEALNSSKVICGGVPLTSPTDDDDIQIVPTPNDENKPESDNDDDIEFIKAVPATPKETPVMSVNFKPPKRRLSVLASNFFSKRGVVSSTPKNPNPPKRPRKSTPTSALSPVLFSDNSAIPEESEEDISVVEDSLLKPPEDVAVLADTPPRKGDKPWKAVTSPSKKKAFAL